MTGGDEGGARKTDWALVLTIAGLVFQMATWVVLMIGNDRDDDVALEKRLCRIEAELGKGECGT